MTDSIELQPTADGVRLRLRVKPGARRTRLVGPHGGALKLEVQAPPERGKANAAVVKLLSSATGIPKSAIEVTTGHMSQDKSVTIFGIGVDALRQKLVDAFDRAGTHGP